MDVTNIIKGVLSEHPFVHMRPEKINSGYCEEFANRVAEVMGYQDNVWDIVRETDWLETDDPAHMFIEWDAKFYDAECPEGVESYRQLPIMLRAKGDQ